MHSTLSTSLSGARLEPSVVQRRTAFVAHAGGEIVLRPFDPAAFLDAVPRRLLPGDCYAGLPFAELATAFLGVIEIDPATSNGKILEESVLGAPTLLSFDIDPRGVVSLRALEGPSWIEHVAPGRSVFGQPASVLEAAGKGFLELQPDTLTAQIASDPSASATGSASARDSDDGMVPRTGPPEQADRSFPRSAVWAWSGSLCLLAGAGIWTWLATEPQAPPEERDVAIESAHDEPKVLPLQTTATDKVGVVHADPDEVVKDFAVNKAGATPGAVRQESGHPAAREEDRLDAVATLLASAEQLGHTYRQHLGALERILRAKEHCDDDSSCSAMFAPTQARVEAALETKGEAYLELVDEAAREFAPALLKRGLGALQSRPAVNDLARQFVAHVELRGTDPHSDPTSILTDLRRFSDVLSPPDPGHMVKGPNT